MLGYTRWPEIHLKKEKEKQQQMSVTVCCFFFYCFSFSSACHSLDYVEKTLTDRHASAAISSKLIGLDWSVIVVGDGVLVPERCPEGGMEGMERWREGGH